MQIGIKNNNIEWVKIASKGHVNFFFVIIEFFLLIKSSNFLKKISSHPKSKFPK